MEQSKALSKPDFRHILADINWEHGSHLVLAAKRSDSQGLLLKSVPFAFVQDKYPCSPLAEKIPEIFAVRHAIAHGHMWHREISIDMEAPRLLSYGSFELHEGFGHRKSFFQYVDLDVQRTKLLRINVTPTRLTKVDVAIVMKIVGEYLLFLDNEVSLELNRSPQSIINIANQYVMYRGRTAKFLDVLNTVHSESA